jgi:hypothetical protein
MTLIISLIIIAAFAVVLVKHYNRKTTSSVTLPEVEAQPEVAVQPEVEAQPEVAVQPEVEAQPEVAVQPEVEQTKPAPTKPRSPRKQRAKKN